MPFIWWKDIDLCYCIKEGGYITYYPEVQITIIEAEVLKTLNKDYLGFL